MKVQVQFDPEEVDRLVLDKWRSQGLIKWSKRREEMLYLPEEKGRENFPLPPELDGSRLMVCISAEETDRVVVCSRDGSRRKPFVPSIGCCADEISGSFMANKHITTVEMEDSTVFIDWHAAIPVRMGGVTNVHIFRDEIWEGSADSYQSSYTPGSDFSAAIAAVLERAACYKAGGENCNGPHYADLSMINNPAVVIAENRQKNSAKKAATG